MSSAVGLSSVASGYVSTALGANSVASGSNSVAIGSYSAATRDNTVSVGTSGAERQIVNVKAGTSDTDAVNVAQLKSAGLSTDTAGNITNAFVAYDSTSKDKVTLAGGAAGTTITNVKAGGLSATSTDAVNGSQLFATNANVSTLQTTVNNISNGSGSRYFKTGGKADGTDDAYAEAQSVAIGAGSNAFSAHSDFNPTSYTNTVAIGNSAKSAGGGAIAIGDTATANFTSIAIGAGANTSGGGRRNVALGIDSSATAWDAVALGSSSVADRNNTISVGRQEIKDVDGNVTQTASTRQIVNMAKGTADTDAVNVSQLKGVTGALGGGAAVNADGSVKAPSYVVQGATKSDVGLALASLDTATTKNAGDITTLNTTVNNISNGTAGLVQQNATTKAITVAGTTAGTTVDFTGTAGTRQLKGVSKGTSDTDAVNVAQLKSAGLSTDTAGNITNAFVAYDSTSKDKVTLAGGAAGTTLTNVKAGGLSATSTDAVNGSQLFATNTNVSTAQTTADAAKTAASTAQTTADTAAAAASNAVQFSATGGNADVKNKKLVNVAAGTSNTDAVNVAQLKAAGLSTDTAGNITNAFVAYDSTSKDTVTLAGGAAGTTITNVKAGTLNATSTDAINGSQLFATNANVTKNTTDLTTLQTTVNNISNGATGLVQQDATTNTITVASKTAGTTVDFTGTAGPRKLVGVASGAADTDAVNMSQLTATNDRVIAGEAAITNLDTRVTQNESGISTLNTNVSNLDGRVSTVESSVTNLTQQLNSGDVGLVQQDASTGNITVAHALSGASVDFAGTTGARVLTGVAAGTVGASSKDAVNGTQLYSVSTSVADAMGGGSTVNADGSISAPSYVIDGQTVHNAGDAIANLNTQISNISTQINTGGLGLVQQNASNGFITVGAASSGSVVDFSGTQGARVLTGVADGAVNSASVDAVNGSQLFAVQENLQQQIASIGTQMTMIDGRVTNVEVNGISNATASGDNSTATGSNSTASGSNGTASGANSTASGDNSTATGANSAASGNNSTASGTNSMASGDNSTATGANSTASGNNSTANGADSIASGNNSTAMGHHAKATGDNSVSIGADSVADRDNTVSMGTSGHERKITNVAAGTQATDAVNLGQMNDALKNAVGNLPAGMSAKDYTDQQINTVQHSVNTVAKNAYAGVAAAMAMPNMTPSAPGKTVVAAGAGSYKSGAALGVGATYRSRNNKWLVNGAVSTTSTGDMGVRAQVGREF
ncbi:MAG: YadA-like family protein [Paraburkholderia sp.]|nr:YadA-like family protein [Paraburkholderia sp.]MDE1183297.1 YadA-like family protein [Paraburkholderia sp.]